jgi:hypothetical protein
MSASVVRHSENWTTEAAFYSFSAQELELPPQVPNGLKALKQTLILIWTYTWNFLFLSTTVHPSFQATY